MIHPTAPRWWQRLSLRSKTLLVTAAPLAVIVVAVPLLFAVQRGAARGRDAVEHAYRVRQGIASVLQDLVDAETGIRGYLLTGREDFLAPYRAGIAAVPVDLAELGRLLGDDPDMRAEFESVRELVGQRVDILHRTHRFAARTPPGVQPEPILERGRVVMEEIRRLLASLDEDEAGRLEAQRAESGRAQRLTSMVSVVVIPIGLLLTVLFGLGFTARLVRSFRRIEENARRMERGEPLLDPPAGDDELSRLGQVLGHTAARLAEQEAELRDLALVDALTGLPNRRAFIQIAEHELQVAVRRSSVTVLLFVDADGLKVVNDRLGHAEGDEMLKELADVLRNQVRSADLVARIGGDEFVVLLSRDSVFDGTEVIDRLRATVEHRNAEAGRRYRLDFSVGAAFFDPLHPVSVDELIRLADAAMYEEKRAKRVARVS